MDTIKYITQIASRANPEIVYDIDLYATNKYSPSYDSVYRDLLNIFQDDLKNNKISILRKDGFTYTGHIHINGIVLWDDIPVTDLEIHFNADNKVFKISATFFTFMGISFSSLLSNVDPLIPSFPKNRIQITKDDSYKDTFTAYAQYLNAGKVYKITRDGNLKITLDIFPRFQQIIDTMLINPALAKREGLPIFFRDYTGISTEPITCDNVNPRYLKQKHSLVPWAYEVPAFVSLPIGNFFIQEINLTPHLGVPEGAFPNKCSKIQFKLLGDKDSMDALQVTPPRSSMLKLFESTLVVNPKKYLLNYDSFARKNDIVIKPNEQYDLAIIPKEDDFVWN